MKPTFKITIEDSAKIRGTFSTITTTPYPSRSTTTTDPATMAQQQDSVAKTATTDHTATNSQRTEIDEQFRMTAEEAREYAFRLQMQAQMINVRIRENRKIAEYNRIFEAGPWA
jgi:hypothetical protein